MAALAACAPSIGAEDADFESNSSSVGTCVNGTVPAGAIWNNDEAPLKCEAACRANGSVWNGEWTTTHEGVMSVCGCDCDVNVEDRSGQGVVVGEEDWTSQCTAGDVTAGRIENEDEAGVTCQAACDIYGSLWNGQWATIDEGVMSVCSCYCPNDPGSNDPTPPRDTELFVPFVQGYWGCMEGAFDGGWYCEDYAIQGIAQGAFLYNVAQHADYVVTAPHGRSDKGTELIVANLFGAGIDSPVQDMSWTSVIGYSLRGHAPSGARHNVNRPSGYGKRDSCNQRSVRSTRVYERYMELVGDYPYKLYVEVHAQARRGLESTIEIATDRVLPSQAARIKEILQEESGLIGRSSERLALAIEPLDTISFNASVAKECGAIARLNSTPVLHMELPVMMRDTQENLLATTRFLSSALRRIASEVFPPANP